MDEEIEKALKTGKRLYLDVKEKLASVGKYVKNGDDLVYDLVFQYYQFSSTLIQLLEIGFRDLADEGKKIGFIGLRKKLRREREKCLDYLVNSNLKEFGNI